MATHDYVLDNATGANFRSDLNNALAAIVSNNSSSTEPSTKYAYQWWADTNEGVLKIRNSSNDGWVTLLQLDGTLTLEDGSNSAPALGFRDDLNTGIFSSAADTLDITCGGTTRGSFSSSGLTVTGTCSATTLTGTLSTAAQTNVTSLGTLTGLTLSGDMTFTGDSANIVFDKSDNALEFADSAKAKFGTDGDLEIFHTSLNDFIQSSGAGFFIDTNNILSLRKVTGEIKAKFIGDGAVELYFDNSKKFETYSNGFRAANNGHIKLASDSGKFFMGAGDDAELFHDGTNLTLNGDGTNDTLLRANSGENSIKLIPNGAVELYFDNSKKFETTTDGVTVTGDLLVSDDVTITDDLFVNDNIVLLDTGKLKLGNNDDLQIYHDGTDTFIDNHEGDLFIRGQDDDIILQPVDGENSVKAKPNGAAELYSDNSKKLETTSYGVNVIGELKVNGAALSTGGGKILQVIQTMKTDTFSSSSSSFTDVTGLSVTITPSATTSKILVMTFVNFAHSGGNRTTARVVRVVGSSEFGLGEGDSAGSRTRGQFIGRHATLNGSSNPVPIQILDSPSTTSACTYKFQFAMIDLGTGQINFGQSDADSSTHARGISTIIAMEVSA